MLAVMTKEIQMVKAYKQNVVRAQRGSQKIWWWALHSRFIVSVFMENNRDAGLILFSAWRDLNPHQLPHSRLPLLPGCKILWGRTSSVPLLKLFNLGWINNYLLEKKLEPILTVSSQMSCRLVFSTNRPMNIWFSHAKCNGFLRNTEPNSITPFKSSS